MERFWRTLREGMLDHIGLAPHRFTTSMSGYSGPFLDQHYHQGAARPVCFVAATCRYWNSANTPSTLSTKQTARGMTVHERRRVPPRHLTLSIDASCGSSDQGTSPAASSPSDAA